MSIPEGDVKKGAALFKKLCLQCHSAQSSDGQGKQGPNLGGVIGRTAGTSAGYSYTAANANSGVVWTEENLFKYLENPKKFIPGTKMVFAGMKKARDRENLIAYLKSTK
uniref:Cytochrome c 2.1 n=1 Tax=Lygus hesperus TaxID=30085 RepID=A0A0A9XQN0_LYGHE